MSGKRHSSPATAFAFLASVVFLLPGFMIAQVILPDSRLPQPGAPDLRGVWGNSASDVYAVGAGGTILHYDGTGWNGFISPVTTNLNSVWSSAPGPPELGQLYTTLLSFEANTRPFGGLTQGTDGDFFGTTTAGGASGLGTVFRITPAGVLTTLHSFVGNDGAFPNGDLIQGTDGNFYGVTREGGAANSGTLFRITPSGALTTLHSFTGSPCCLTCDGATPVGGLVQGADGDLYGTTFRGGACQGTVFKITLSGAYTRLHTFVGSEGRDPYPSLIQGTDGNFYGTTNAGGAADLGTVFKITPAGVLTTIHSFAQGEGTGPTTGVIQGTDGYFYGTTGAGGAGGLGTVFRITPSGQLTTLHSFSGSDGRYPSGDLILGTDGNFYGTTYGGGPSDKGTAFKITPGGMLTTLHSFTWSDGANPYAGLVQGTDGNLYGTTFLGGAYQGGVIFRLAVPAVMPQAFAVGASGTVLRLLGSAWIQSPSATGWDLTGVSGTSPSDVWAVGAGGVILHYDGNAAGTWTHITTHPYDLHAVYARSPTDVYVVGDHSWISHYDGTTWSGLGTPPPLAADISLRAVSGSQSGKDLVIAGDRGYFAYYDQGSWEEPSLQDGRSFFGIALPSARDAYAVGHTNNTGLPDADTIWHSNSLVWDQVRTFLSTDMFYRAAWAPSGSELFIVGEQGLILHLVPPQLNPAPVVMNVLRASTCAPADSHAILWSFEGEGFTPQSVANFPGALTSYISGTHLNVQIPESAWVPSYYSNIRVTNPGPGGGLSKPFSLATPLSPTELTVRADLATVLYTAGIGFFGTLTSLGCPLYDRRILFGLNGTNSVWGSTDVGGTATGGFPPRSLNASPNPYPEGGRAEFFGDTLYAPSAASTPLTVLRAPTSLSVLAGPSNGGALVNATLWSSSDSRKLNGRTLSFRLNGQPPLSAITDSGGIATIWLPGLVPGWNVVEAAYGGELNFTDCAESNTFSSDKIATAIFVGAPPVPFPRTPTLSATLREVSTGKGIGGKAISFQFLGVNQGTGYTNPDGVATVVLLSQANPRTYPGGVVATFAGDLIYSGSTGSADLTVLPPEVDLSISDLTIAPEAQQADDKALWLVARVKNEGAYATAQAKVEFCWGPTKLTCSPFFTATGRSIAAGTTLDVYVKYAGDTPMVFPSVPSVVSARVSSVDVTDRNAQNNSRDLTISESYGTPFSVIRDSLSFGNHVGPTPGWDVFRLTFGPDNVEYTSCSSLIPKLCKKPLALAWFLAAYRPSYRNGTCFGMAAKTVLAFDQRLAIYGLTTSYSDALWAEILYWHGVQTGDAIYTNAFLSLWESPAAALLAGKIALTGGEPLSLGIRHDTFSSHTVVPYRIVQTTNPEGAITAWMFAYDPSHPGDPTTAVTVDVNAGIWTYAKGGWSGRGGLVAMTKADLARPPRLPDVRRILQSGVKMVFGTVEGAARLLHTDSVGRAFGWRDGAFVTEIPGAAPAVTFTGATGEEEGVEGYWLPVGEYGVTLSGKGDGSASASWLGEDSVLTVSTETMTSATRDIVMLRSDGRGLTLQTNMATERFSVELSLQLESSGRQYGLSNAVVAAGETVGLSMADDGTSFQFANQGAPKVFDLALSQVGTINGTISLTDVAIGAGESETFRVRDWTNLETSPVDLEVKGSDGAIRRTDSEPPVITITTPGNGAKVEIGSRVTASFSCADPSGVSSCVGTLPTGSALDTASVGQRAFTVTAMDTLRHTASLTHPYSVVFPFTGFLQPIDNLPVLNSVKAGRAVPVKFGLGGDKGLGIMAAGSPSSITVGCDSSAPTGIVEETSSAGGSSLTYDTVAGQYVYVWKTDSAWANTCRQLIVTLIDGTTHRANFTFTR